MTADAETHREEDEKRKKIIDAKNIGEQMIYTAEKSLSDYKDKVADDIKVGVETKIKELREALQGDSLENIENGTRALSTEMQKIGEAMAKQPGTSPDATKKEENGDEPVRDADVKENT